MTNNITGTMTLASDPARGRRRTRRVRTYAATPPRGHSKFHRNFKCVPHPMSLQRARDRKAAG